MHRSSTDQERCRCLSKKPGRISLAFNFICFVDEGQVELENQAAPLTIEPHILGSEEFVIPQMLKVVDFAFILFVPVFVVVGEKRKKFHGGSQRSNLIKLTKIH